MLLNGHYKTESKLDTNFTFQMIQLLLVDVGELHKRPTKCLADCVFDSLFLVC